MSQVFSNILGSLKKNPVGAITGGAGAVSNFINSRKQNSYLNNQLAYQKLLMQMAKNPQMLRDRVAGFEKPLDQGLVSGVGNAVQANLAQRGLGASPSIANDVFAQALAPYQQHNQDLAVQEAFQSLGLPTQSGAVPQFNQPQDLAMIIKNLLDFKGGAPSPVSLPTGGPSVIPPPSNDPNVGPPTNDQGVIGNLPGGQNPDLSSLILSLGGGSAPTWNPFQLEAPLGAS